MRLRRKTIRRLLIAVVGLSIAGAGVWYWFSPQRRARWILSEAESLPTVSLEGWMFEDWTYQPPRPPERFWLWEWLGLDEPIESLFDAETALVKLGPPAVGPLIETLDHESPRMVSMAYSAIGKIGGRRAVEALVQRMDDEGSSYGAAMALAEIGDRVAIEPLARWIASRPTVEVESSVIELPSGRRLELQPQTAPATQPGPVIIESVDRTYVIEALGMMGDARAVEALLGVLAEHGKPKGDEVRPNAYDETRAALWALGQIGDVRATGVLEAWAKSANTGFDHIARRALEKIRGGRPPDKEAPAFWRTEITF